MDYYIGQRVRNKSGPWGIVIKNGTHKIVAKYPNGREEEYDTSDSLQLRGSNMSAAQADETLRGMSKCCDVREDQS